MNTSTFPNVSYNMDSSVEFSLYIILGFNSIVVVQNTFLLLLLLGYSSLRQRSYTFLILCLCVGDLIFGIAGVWAIISVLNPSVLSVRYCCTLHVFIFSSVIISLVQSTLICLERFLHVRKFPSRESVFQGNNTYKITAIFWAFFLIFIGVSFILTPKTDKIVADCFLQTIYPSHYQQLALVLSLFIVPVFICNVVIFILLADKMRHIYRSVMPLPQTTTPMGHVTNTSNPPNTVNSSVNILKQIYVSVAMIMVLEFVCYGPFVVNLVMDSVLEMPVIFRAGSFVLISLNSLVNPILYVWRLEDVRNVLLKMKNCQNTLQPEVTVDQPEVTVDQPEVSFSQTEEIF